MNMLQAQEAIRARIETEWALSAYAAIPLVWENELADTASTFVAVTIESTWAEKTIFGSAGKRSSVESGIIFYHAFVPFAAGRDEAMSMVLTMTAILELQTVATSISIDGANPPTPVESVSARDRELPTPQPSGMFYRCTGSASFIVIDAI